jgi:hypothetical protein
MAQLDVGGVERVLARSGMGRPRPATRAFWLLLLLFVALQIADVVTTNAALALPGHWEANPIVALSQTHLGHAWWLPKAVAVGFFCAMATVSRQGWPLIVAVSAYVLVVLVNFAQL